MVILFGQFRLRASNFRKFILTASILCLVVLGQSCIIWYHASYTKHPRSVLGDVDVDSAEAKSKRIVEVDALNDEAAEPLQETNVKEFARRIEASIFKFPDKEDVLSHIDYSRSHILQNKCRLPILEPDEPDLAKYVKHYRAVHCPKSNSIPFVTQLRNGEILFGKPHRNGLKEKVECFAREISGTLRPTVRRVKEVGIMLKLEPNRRVSVQWHQFLVKCYSDSKQLLFHDVFTNVPMRKPRRTRKHLAADKNPYSISVFIIDSASRSQFFRHMPLTMDFLRTNDFQILHGLTKIGDNSAINLLGVLAGMVYEPEQRGFNGLYHKDMVLEHSILNNTSDDFWPNIHSVIQMTRESGYTTMWNDDIATTGFGLFHYNAFRGFKTPPTDYYYRPYYEYLYQKLGAHTGCVNGEIVAPRYIDIWERFVTNHLNTPHFAFNFLTGLTHASANNIELYDNSLSEALERLKSIGYFENSFVLIMGDHGQRISAIQRSHSGRVEERMPMLGIYLPPNFRRDFPDKYRNLTINKNRLTSSFDIYETLIDILQISNVDVSNSTSVRMNSTPVGISLFDSTPTERGCREARIPPQFCVCLEPAHNETLEQKKLSSAVEITGNCINNTLHHLECLANIDKQSLVNTSSIQFYSLSKMVRLGVRHPKQWKQFVHKNGPAYISSLSDDVLEVELDTEVDVKTTTPHKFHIRSRLSLYKPSAIDEDEPMLRLKVKPLLLNPPCPHVFVLDDLCNCFGA